MIARAVAALILAGLGASLHGPAQAADRTYSVTEFDKIDVDGPYQVSVETGKAPSAHASGGQTGLDRLSVVVRSERLVIRPLKSGWGERSFLKSGPITIRVTVPGLKRIDMAGSGSLTINRIRTARLSVGQEGSGVLRIGQIAADQLDMFAAGDGQIVLGGKILSARVSNSGTGRIDAPGLIVSDLDLKSDSAGETRIGVLRAAKVLASGSGNVVIVGTPACSVTALGAGEVSCGSGAQ